MQQLVLTRLHGAGNKRWHPPAPTLAIIHLHARVATCLLDAQLADPHAECDRQQRQKRRLRAATVRIFFHRHPYLVVTNDGTFSLKLAPAHGEDEEALPRARQHFRSRFRKR